MVGVIILILILILFTQKSKKENNTGLSSDNIPLCEEECAAQCIADGDAECGACGGPGYSTYYDPDTRICRVDQR
jgi:hypothetical protein